MFEALDFYGGLGALPRALLLFPLGLVVGSFSTMLYYRLGRGESIVRPRSHCPACGHALGAADLMPVLSYLWLRGRCRYCRGHIPGRYLLLESCSGLVAAAAGAVGGWGAGLAMVVLVPAGVALLAGTKGRRRQSEAGVTLVEILVAMALLVVVAIPMYQAFTNNLRGLSTYQRQYAIQWAASQMEDFQSQVAGYTGRPWSLIGSPGECRQVGNLYFWLDARTTPVPGSTETPPLLQQVTITVNSYADDACQNATGFPDVRTVAILAKTP